MKFLIVGITNNPQIERIDTEAKKRGHGVDTCLSSDLSLYFSDNNYSLFLKGKEFGKYDLIYLWTLGDKRWDWYLALRLLREKSRLQVVNSCVVDPSYMYTPSPTLSFINQSRERLPFPKSAIVFSEKETKKIINNYFSFPLVIKGSRGRKGEEIFKLEKMDEVGKVIKRLQEVSPAFIVREFIPNDGDIRVFTIGYKTVGAMRRYSTRKGEFRSNISLGGKGEAFMIEKHPDIQLLAERAAKATRIEIAGVDIIVNKITKKLYILEVNPGPQFMGLEEYTKINVAENIVKYFESLVEKV